MNRAEESSKALIFSGKSWHAVAWLLQPSPVSWDTSLGPRERALWPRSKTAISVNALAQSGPCLTVSTVWHKRTVSLLPHSTENHCPALHTKIALLCLPGGQHERLRGTGEQSGRAAALGVNFSWKEKREHYENAMRAVWGKKGILGYDSNNFIFPKTYDFPTFANFVIMCFKTNKWQGTGHLPSENMRNR